MKTLIVFISLIVVFSMFLSYLTDMNEYMQNQKLLKMLAEDCACAGALTIENNQIDRDRALNEAKRIIASSKLFPDGSISISSCEITKDGKGFKIELTCEEDDYFKLPFIKEVKIRRISEYAWE